MLGNLQFFRFWAIMIIAVFHGFRGIGIVPNGYLFVEFFFIASGFFAMESYHKRKPDLKKSIVTRFLRLYPVFLISNILFFIVSAYYGREFSSNQIMHTLLFLSYSPFSTTIPLISWFCPALFWSGIVMFLLIRFPRTEVGKFIITLSTSVLLYAYIFYTTTDLGGISHVYFDLFSKGFLRGVAGVSLGAALSYFKLLTAQKNLRGLQVLEILTLIIFAYVQFAGQSVPIQIAHILVSVALIILCYQNKTYLMKKFDHRYCVFLGNIAFSIYLSHVTFIAFMKHASPDYFDNAKNLATYVPAVILLGVAFYYLIEKPINMLVSRKFKKT